MIKLFHMLVWCAILVFSIYLMIKCIQIFGNETKDENEKVETISIHKEEDSKDSVELKAIETSIISAICNYMIQSTVSILNYVSNIGDIISDDLIMNTFIVNMPINRYVALEDQSEQENTTDKLFASYIDEIERIDFIKNNHFFLNNELYIAMILQGIGEYNEKKNTENQLIENEYDLSAVIDGSSIANTFENLNQRLMPIDIVHGEIYVENEELENVKETLGSINGEHFTMKQLLDRQFLYNNFYIIDSATSTEDELFDAEVLLGKDMTIKNLGEKPQILIYHTHSQEGFLDSREGVEEDTVVGVGNYLTELLKDVYGYEVIHDKTEYDIVKGTLDRNLAYNYAGDGVETILLENPSIEVIIDLHRDGASKRVTKINGESVAQIMLFNGLSRNVKGKIDYLVNPYLEDNLAFSLQLQLQGREKYPGLFTRNYLHAYRYNLHLREKSLLVEAGTNENTVEEVKNSMVYLAEMLNDLLRGK